MSFYSLVDVYEKVPVVVSKYDIIEGEPEIVVLYPQTRIVTSLASVEGLFPLIPDNNRSRQPLYDYPYPDPYVDSFDALNYRYLTF